MGALRAQLVCGLALIAALASCTNNPYPPEEQQSRVHYAAFAEAPRTLDPAVAYTTSAHVITANVYDTLLEYHYLKRPYELIPALAEAMPQSRELLDGRMAFRFRLREEILFQHDPCFKANGQADDTRRVTAQDFAFQIARLADPEVNSPVLENFSVITGFRAFTELLGERRKDPEFAALRIDRQYEAAGGVPGVVVLDDREFEIVLDERTPYFIYWFAMPFTTPVPWEAVVYYDGNGGRDRFADHPVGTGPYTLSAYEKQFRYILEKNPLWYGVRHPEWQAPGATFPTEISQEDIDTRRIDPVYAGRALPFVERIEFRRESESIPQFNKLLQGYYDQGGIINESFDAVVQGDRLSPEMAERGITLDRAVEPSVFYIGFNMEDPVLGHDAGERGRKLRQAMSLVINVERYLDVFLNGRGVPAQSPLPPGMFGYDEVYVNPYRQVDVARARALLEEAGYARGIDPQTGAPLRLTFDTGNTSAQSRLRYQFFVSAWRGIGLDVEIAATTYNKFQEKVRSGAYQIFQWGWIGDYPDPENFLFLLTSANARSVNDGPNTANFMDDRYDQLFAEMKNRENDPRRLEIIGEMLALLQEERPWIELFHSEDYVLRHAWLRNAKPMGLSYPVLKYRDIDPQMRADLRAQWNKPVLWPLYALILFAVAAIVPAIRTLYRERQ
jgi:ABC-type transport system substrate-binding protein